jgi:hypothetical protein
MLDRPGIVAHRPDRGRMQAQPTGARRQGGSGSNLSLPRGVPTPLPHGVR